MTAVRTVSVQLPLFDLPERDEFVQQPAVPLSARVQAALAAWQSDIASGVPVTPATLATMIGDLTAILIDEMEERARGVGSS